MYCAPHQEIQKVCHIRKYRMYAISGNALYLWRRVYTPHQEIQYTGHHIRKCKKYATSGYTVYAPYQETLCICKRHTKKYKKYVTSGNIACTPYQEMLSIVCRIREYKKYVTSGNTGYTPYQEMLLMSEEQYWRRIRRYNILYATSRYTKGMPHQEIQCVVLHIRKYKKYIVSGTIGCVS